MTIVWHDNTHKEAMVYRYSTSSTLMAGLEVQKLIDGYVAEYEDECILHCIYNPVFDGAWPIKPINSQA